MLPAGLQDAWSTEARALVRLLAVQPAFLVKPTGGPLAVNVALKTIGPTDVDLVNTWGLGARVLTIPADELPPGTVVDRFDRVQIGTSLHTADYVHEIRLGDEVIAWKLYARGRQE